MIILYTDTPGSLLQWHELPQFSVNPMAICNCRLRFPPLYNLNCSGGPKWSHKSIYERLSFLIFWFVLQKVLLHPFSFWNLFHTNMFNSSTNTNVFNLIQWNVFITHVCVWASLGYQEQSLSPKYLCQNSNPKPWFIILSLFLSDRIWLNLGS